MLNVQLTPRLSAIADLVPRGSFIADIGTDHAFLPIYLIQNSTASRAIAADIVEGPLNIARKNIKAHGLEDKIEVIQSDGLDKVSIFTPETVIIAGMGGETIRDILKASSFAKESSPLFLLQPMTHTELLREYLIQNGFSILEEKVIREEHRYYIIISAQFKREQKHYFKDNLSFIEELGGIIPPLCDDASDYLKWRKEVTERTLKALSNAQNPTEKADVLSKLLTEIDRRLSLCSK